MTKANNKNLRIADKVKNNEFYTLLPDIEKELVHYKEHFKGKVVFCNCDDPRESNFWKYFSLNFKHFGLKKLISTHFDANASTYKLEMISMEQLPIQTPLKENGDFRSQECIDILKEVDIVVTNPPFSLFREYIGQLIEYNKKFIIVGNMNAISYKETFKLIKDNKVWLGCNGRLKGDFKTPNGNIVNVMTAWFTNIEHKKRHQELILYRTYKGHEGEYLKYDNYNAINVNKTIDIPTDYADQMGVPISFMDKYNPNQFEIVGIFADKREISDAIIQGTQIYIDEQHKKFVGPVVNGKATYARIIIKNRKVQS